MPSEIAEFKTDTWNALIYICSVLVVVGISLVIFFTITLCRRLRRNKKLVPPPTPPVKRNATIYTIYPPSPHTNKLPTPTKHQDEEPETPSVLEVEQPPSYSIKQEVKLSPLVLDALQGHVVEITRSPSGSHLIRIPKYAGDLPSIHAFPPPPPPYSPSMARPSLKDTFLTLT